MTIHKKELFTIPNLMGYFRILLIPVFMYIYINAHSTADTYHALAVLILSGITDFFDGIAARKLHQVTELGKALDPIADKLTLGAVILCLIETIQGFQYLFAVFAVKELYMLFGNLISMRSHGRKLDGAAFIGKAATMITYWCMGFFLLFPHMPRVLQIILMLLCGSMMIASGLYYLPIFYRYIRGN